jgi:hypothetical protein
MAMQQGYMRSSREFLAWSRSLAPLAAAVRPSLPFRPAFAVALFFQKSIFPSCPHHHLSFSLPFSFPLIIIVSPPPSLHPHRPTSPVLYSFRSPSSTSYLRSLLLQKLLKSPGPVSPAPITNPPPAAINARFCAIPSSNFLSSFPSLLHLLQHSCQYLAS